MIVMPLSKTNVHWAAFIKAASESLGRSVTRSLDQAKMKPETLHAYICGIAEMRKKDSTPIDVIRDPGSLLRHVSYGFMVAASKQVFFEILESSDLAVSITNTLRKDLKFGIVTGTLEQWRAAVVNGCSRQSSDSAREFYTLCVQYLDNEGFGPIWVNYKRVNQGGLLLLEKK